MRVTNSSGFSATVSGTPLPPTTPARIRWNVSAAYTLEQDGHSDARRFPQRTCSTPSGLSLAGVRAGSRPVARSIVVAEPRSRIGRAQWPTRASARDQASKSDEMTRPASCSTALGESGDVERCGLAESWIGLSLEAGHGGVDDEERENEGDLVMAAEKVTPEAINFMATHGRGLICAPMTSERA